MSDHSYKPAPSWLSDVDGPASAVDSSRGPAAAGSAPPPKVVLTPQAQAVFKYKNLILWGLKIATLALSCLMAFTALYALSHLDGFSEIGKVFVGVYMLCFAGVLFSFELIHITPIEALNNIYRRNFGFLYGTKGKGLFIIL